MKAYKRIRRRVKAYFWFIKESMKFQPLGPGKKIKTFFTAIPLGFAFVRNTYRRD